jgi:hypothetical protein
MFTQNTLKSASDTLYASTQYTNLSNLFTQYNEWSSTASAKYEAAAQALNSATESMLAYKLSQDATGIQVVVNHGKFNIKQIKYCFPYIFTLDSHY